MNLKSKYIYCSVEQLCAMLSSFEQHYAALSVLCSFERSFFLQCWAVLCSFVHSSAVLCSIEQCWEVLCSIDQCWAVLCSLVQYWAVLCCFVQCWAVLCSLVHFNAWNKIKGFQFSDNLFLRLGVYKGARGLFGFTSPLKRKSVNIIVLIFKRRNRTEFCTINWMHSYPDVAYYI